MKTIATTISADVVIYQDGTVEVVTDCALHANGTPAIIKLDEMGAFYARGCFTADELADAGMLYNQPNKEQSRAYDAGERLGFAWVVAALHLGEMDKVADLSFDHDTRRRQGEWCINLVSSLRDGSYYAARDGWMNGFHLAVCEAFSTVPGWIKVYNRHKALNANPAPVPASY